MPVRQSHKVGSELFIVDNSEEEWRALRYLRDWCELSKAIDIATGFFEIGALLGLDSEWQKVEKIRILMGDEVSKCFLNSRKHGAPATRHFLSKVDCFDGRRMPCRSRQSRFSQPLPVDTLQARLPSP